jgi:hypothetical protein
VEDLAKLGKHGKNHQQFGFPGQAILIGKKRHEKRKPEQKGKKR